MKTKSTRVRAKAVLVFIFLWTGCEDFLETKPYGTTTLQTLSGQSSGAEMLLIAAYSNLDGVFSNNYPWSGAASNWVFGSIAGGDAYKGSTPGDQGVITPIESHYNLTAGNGWLEGKWATYYNGIARANDAIRAFKTLTGVNADFRNMRMAEARFLRGYYHLELRKIFGKVPFIDESMEDTRVGNEIDILPSIQQDFLYASKHLPITQDQRGRATKGAAQTFHGICKMWERDFTNAKIYFDSVISSNRYKLNTTYHDNFNVKVRNTPESILEAQTSVNDGGSGANGNVGDELNYPNGDNPVGCCGFHQPSQNLVNAFQTDASGLPLLDSYNLTDVKNDEGLNSTDPSFTLHGGNLDPRLDWTVGRRGIPYLDWGKHPGKSWIRDQNYGGPYSPKKNVHYQSEAGTYSQTRWSNDNANNIKLLRYSDLLLYAAEAEVELGNLEAARLLVNQVRDRAANPAGFVMDGTSKAANYLVKSYSSFPDQVYARKAVRFERRIELGMEGHRFFDLVRWGIAADEKNAYFEKERIKRTYLADAHFEKDKNEVLPIPQKAIDLSYKNGVATLQQNSGY